MSSILTEHGFLPLSSLRLIVPPLQLVSAALWEIVRQGAVMYYGLLEEFVCTVLEQVPELLTYTERVQLAMGLRAKVVLEMCRNDDFANPQAMEPHLSRINTYLTNQDKEKIFPTVFGPKYDSALQALMRKFLFNLQKLLPVPNLEQVALSSTGDDCILSSLSYHLLNVDNDEGDALVKSECVSQECQGSNLPDRQVPYLCDTCGKGWPSAAQLKLHMVQHTEDRPFKCEDCDACYKRGSHLNAHRRVKHLGLRPFVCEVSPKEYKKLRAV
ncbi:Zinc finger protein [Collichthys lucidus]|uniref:Zinc finger protein n=1 Tax=Collichthys lucidus TaxID=240159 RepID=A0A4V6ARK1_COLLU|nr:Zinc finger protein [Collichthys lucidus]